MPPEIVVGLLAFAGTVVGTYGGILTANKLTNYRVSQLEKKVDKHNTVIERTYALEKDSALNKQDHEEMKQDISEIKEILKEKSA